MCFCLLGYPSSIYFSLANSLRTSTDTMLFPLKRFYSENLSRPSLVHWPDLKRKSKCCASVIPSRRSEGFSIANLSFTSRAFPPCSKAKRRKFSPRLDDDTLRLVRSRIRGFCYRPCASDKHPRVNYSCGRFACSLPRFVFCQVVLDWRSNFSRILYHTPILLGIYSSPQRPGRLGHHMPATSMMREGHMILGSQLFFRD